jgi:broad specificity phosphatase PhoE
MTTKADFTEEEWTRLERGPLVAGMAITFADPGGPIEALKESLAAVKTIAETAKTGSRSELVDALAKDVAEKAQRRENPLKGFKPKGTLAGQEILDELREVNEIATQKATPEEAAAYRQWLLDAAQRVADAAKEGGFLGFHAVRVSEGEQKMLDRLSEALGTSE